jgi:hypothetical protein
MPQTDHHTDGHMATSEHAITKQKEETHDTIADVHYKGG